MLGWFESLWDTMTAISVGYIVAGVFFQTIQTTLTALAWYYILAAGYPDGGVRYRDILAAYAAGVAMNGFLPANIGTFVSLLMYVALIRGSTFPGVLGAMMVQKIFYTAIGVFVYIYLFASVPGTFDLQLGGITPHPVLWLAIIVGGAVLIVMLVRVFRRRRRASGRRRSRAARSSPRRATTSSRCCCPRSDPGSRSSRDGVFLAAYGIPVTFHTIMSVIGGNSLANTVSFTPGGVGITQAVNNVSLAEVTDSATATAYSLGQQLIVTAWNVVFAIVLVVWVFGWTGGKLLVGQSYTGAKEKAAEQSAAHKARKEQKREARHAKHEAQDAEHDA